MASRRGFSKKAVRRLRDLVHRSHIGQVSGALRTPGQRVALEVKDTAS